MAEHTFKIDIDEDRIVDAVAARIIAQHSPEYDEEGEIIESTSGRKTIDVRVQQLVQKLVREHVESQVKAITGEHIMAAVAAVMDEGWQATNNYGEPTGPRLTLRARIGEIITKLSGNSYDSNRKTLVDDIIARKVDEAIGPKSEIAKIIDEAKTKLRATIDGAISARLTETLRTALGLPK